MRISGEERAIEAISRRNEVTSIRSWILPKGRVELFFNELKRLEGRITQNGMIYSVSKEWISGIPDELLHSIEELRLFLQNTYVKVSTFSDGGFNIRILPRLPGGGQGSSKEVDEESVRLKEEREREELERIETNKRKNLEIDDEIEGLQKSAEEIKLDIVERKEKEKQVAYNIKVTEQKIELTQSKILKIQRHLDELLAQEDSVQAELKNSTEKVREKEIQKKSIQKEIHQYYLTLKLIYNYYDLTGDDFGFPNFCDFISSLQAFPSSPLLCKSIDSNLLISQIFQNKVLEACNTFAGKEIVIFLGLTGAGKSTTIASLLGAKLVIKREGNKSFIDYESDEELFHIQKQNPFVTILPIIGNQTSSCTETAIGYRTYRGVYVDTGGFFDNRSKELDSMNAFSIYLATIKAKKVKFVLCSSFADMKNSRGALLHQLLERIFNRFIPVDNPAEFSKKFGKSIFFLSTFANEYCEIEERIESLSGFSIANKIRTKMREEQQNTEISPGILEWRQNVYHFLLRDSGKYISTIHPTSRERINTLSTFINEEMEGIDLSHERNSVHVPFSVEVYTQLKTECLGLINKGSKLLSQHKSVSTDLSTEEMRKKRKTVELSSIRSSVVIETRNLRQAKREENSNQSNLAFHIFELNHLMHLSRRATGTLDQLERNIRLLHQERP